MSHSPPLVWHEAIGAQIRAGAYQDHAASTYSLAATALQEGRGEDAAALANYTVQEGLEAYELFTDWAVQIRAFMAERGVEEKVLAGEAARIAGLVAGADGAPFDGDAGWARYKAQIADFAARCAAGAGVEVLPLLDAARNTWRETHDRLCDVVYGWVDATARHLGEEVIGALWDALMAPMYAYYVRYDTDNNPWARSFDLLMHYALEGLRGHLSGPGRMGALEVVEEADRWAIRFAPCGSGGRTLRDDPDSGTGPRQEAPYHFGVTQKAHDWAWNKTGICLYCVHCCALNERMPIARFGYPTRVVEPPVWPRDRNASTCTWYVYKHPSLVPDEIYRRVGAVKPAQIGGAAQRAAAAPAQEEA